MPRNEDRPLRELKLFSRPRDVIEAEQKRHDRALKRGLIAVFCSLFLGGGLAMFVVRGPWFGSEPNLQILLVGLVFVVPVLASVILMARVPPPPFESLGDAHRDLDKKQAEWRAVVLSQVFVFGMLAAESVWLGPRLMRLHGRYSGLLLLSALVPMLCLVLLVVMSLYVGPGGMNRDLDDEVTRSFRARAQRLGYLLLLLIFAGVCVLARISPETAARFMPLGLALGGALPMLYFIYLDWQASRSG